MKDKKKLIQLVIALTIAFGTMYGVQYLLGKSDESQDSSSTQVVSPSPVTNKTVAPQEQVSEVQGVSTAQPMTNTQTTPQPQGQQQTQSVPQPSQPQPSQPQPSNNNTSRNDSESNTIVDQDTAPVDSNEELNNNENLSN